jgi:hypothetical protein
MPRGPDDADEPVAMGDPTMCACSKHAALSFSFILGCCT